MPFCLTSSSNRSSRLFAAAIGVSLALLWYTNQFQSLPIDPALLAWRKHQDTTPNGFQAVKEIVEETSPWDDGDTGGGNNARPPFGSPELDRAGTVGFAVAEDGYWGAPTWTQPQSTTSVGQGVQSTDASFYETELEEEEDPFRILGVASVPPTQSTATAKRPSSPNPTGDKPGQNKEASSTPAVIFFHAAHSHGLSDGSGAVPVKSTAIPDTTRVLLSHSSSTPDPEPPGHASSTAEQATQMPLTDRSPTGPAWKKL